MPIGACNPMLCLIRVCLVIHRSSVIELAQQMGSTVLDFSAVGDPAGIGRLASGAGGEKIGALSVCHFPAQFPPFCPD